MNGFTVGVTHGASAMVSYALIPLHMRLNNKNKSGSVFDLIQTGN